MEDDFWDCCQRFFNKVKNIARGCCIPTPTIDGEPFICSGSTELTCPGEYDSYEWFLNGYPLGLYDQTIEASQTGNYKVIGYKNGAWRASDVFSFVVASESEIIVNPDYMDDILFFDALSYIPDRVSKDNYFLYSNRIITVSDNPGIPIIVSPCIPHPVQTDVLIVIPGYGSNYSDCGDWVNFYISSSDTYDITASFNYCLQVSLQKTIIYENQIQAALLDFGDIGFTQKSVSKNSTGWRLKTNGIGDVSGFSYTNNIVWKKLYDHETGSYVNDIVATNTDHVDVTEEGIYSYVADGILLGEMIFFVKN